MHTDALWLEFTGHLARLYAPVAPTVESGPGWLAVLSREPHTDVNICVLLSDATRERSAELIRLVETVDAGGRLGADRAGRRPARAAAAGGVRPEPLSEPLMWLGSRPSPVAGDFEIRRVTNGGELSQAIEVAAEGHGFERSMLSRILSRDVHADEDVATWIAWSGDEAASVAWLTAGSRIGVWQMNTPPRHRRRGAARATLVAS